MHSLRRPLPQALRSQARRFPSSTAPVAYFSSTSCYATSGANDARFQEKDQVQAEKAAKDPKKMANLGKEENKKRDDPHQTSGNLTTPGVKGKVRESEPIGKNVSNTPSG